MMPKSKWGKEELAYFHHALQQIKPYLNAESQSIHREITEEIIRRGGLKRNDLENIQNASTEAAFK
jgi:hypothetical protein